MKTISKLLFIAFVSFALSCTKKDESPVFIPPPAEVADNVKDVYVCGSVKVGNNDVAVYWKNGVAVYLTQSPNNGGLNDIFVVGNDVYACGYEEFDGASVAKYWKNGVGTALSGGNVATGITVVGNDVHVCGNVTGDTYFRAKYWKNNAASVFALSDMSSSATDICSEGNDIYISGRDNQASVYWKNKERTQIGVNGTSDVSTFNNSNSIHVVGTDVYSGGEAGGDRAGYWKNSNYVSLSTNYSFVLDIEPVGNDVYTCGLLFSYNPEIARAAFWKNLTPTYLSSTVSVAYGIKVANTNVYVCGRDNFNACYWKNRKKFIMSTLQSSAKSIFLTYN